MSSRHGATARRLRSPVEPVALERRRSPERDATDLQQGAGDETGNSDRQPARLPRRSIIGLAWNRTRHYGASARLTTALTPSTTLVSLTAFRKLDREFVVDTDSTELDLITTHQRERQHQLSEEVTISYQQPGLTWVGGVFLFDETDRQTLWVDQPAAGFQLQLDPRVDATSRAVFGQATVGVTSWLAATGGLRYTHERKEIDNAGGRYGLEVPHPAVPGSTYSYSDSITHSAWTPKVGLEMTLPNDALTYVSATRGFKSGASTRRQGRWAAVTRPSGRGATSSDGKAR